MFGIKFKSLKKELSQIDSLIYSISQGDLTKTLNIKTKHNNRLFSNLNSLIKTLRGLIAQIITIQDKTIRYTSEIKNDAEIIKSSSKENSKIINDISKNMEEQMFHVKEAKDYSTDIINAARKVAKESENIKQMEYSNIETISISYDNFQALISRMEKTAVSNINTNKKIKSLEEKTHLIQSIADQVSKISKNTTLLSLNASIEAARAGEAGKGFSVVASEVSKLAESSTLQARQIEEIVTGIKQEINDISSDIENDIHAIKEYIQFSQITKQHLDKIKSDAKNTFEAFIEIDNQIENQVDKVSKVGDIVYRVYNTFEALSSSTAEIAAASEEESKITENIFSKLMNLSYMNKEIKQYVSSFIKNYKIDSKTQEYINNSVKTLKQIANIQELSSMDYSTCTPILKSELDNHPYFELLALMDLNGLRKSITLAYSEQEVYVNFSHRPYFREAIAGRDFISEPYISVDTNNYCIAISVPVRNKDKIVGILMADLKL